MHKPHLEYLIFFTFKNHINNPRTKKKKENLNRFILKF